MTFVKAMLQDVAKKYDSWKSDDETCDVFQKGDELYKKGIEEVELQNHDCGDLISVVKLVYNILYRWNILTLLSTGSHSIDPKLFDLPDKKNENDLEQNPDHCSKMLQELIEKDPYLQEKAPKAKSFMSIDSKAFEKCTTSDHITAVETECQEALTDIKTVIAAMRRSMKVGT